MHFPITREGEGCDRMACELARMPERVECALAAPGRKAEVENVVTVEKRDAMGIEAGDGYEVLTLPPYHDWRG